MLYSHGAALRADAAIMSAYTRPSAECNACVHAPVMDRINKATQVIGTMIAEVSKDVFVADPSGEQLSGVAPYHCRERGCLIPRARKAAADYSSG